MKQYSEVKNLPDKLAPLVWRYLRHKKWHLAGCFLVALVWARECSSNCVTSVIISGPNSAALQNKFEAVK